MNLTATSFYTNDPDGGLSGHLSGNPCISQEPACNAAMIISKLINSVGFFLLK
jgi:hypothetical protein